MKAHYKLKRSNRLFPLIAIFAIGLAGCGAGRQAYSRGTRAELAKDYDQAQAEYKTALDRNPGNVEYQLRYEQARFNAAFEHFEKGRRALQANDLETAKMEFTRTLQIDPTYTFAQQQLDLVNEALTKISRKEPEPETRFDQLRESTRTNPSVQAQLMPKITGPFDIHMPGQDSRVAFQTLAELAGLNVIFDPDFRGSRIPIELNNVTIYEALDILALQTRSFWKPINETTILIAPDNQTKRRDYEELVLKTIYLSNSVTSTEITEAITALRTLLNMRYLAQSTSMNAIVIRDTADRVAIAEKIIEDLDKAKPEVIVDATILEVDRNTLRQLGILPPQGTSLDYISPNGTTGDTTGGNTSNTQVRLNRLSNLNTGNFAITIPQSVAQFLATSSGTKLIQNPRVRATDGKLASIRIGSQVPIASGSFQPAFVGATGTPVVNFQFVDVGVNLDITPRVLLNREISMTVMVQVRAVAGDRNIGGVTQPVLTNRQVQHEIRLTEGETNILGGIITDTEATSLSGVPGLKDVPILKYLFSQEKKTRDQTEIIVMLTPHIVRMPTITEENMRGLYTGSETIPRLRSDREVPSMGDLQPAAEAPAASQPTSEAPAAPETPESSSSTTPSAVAPKDAEPSQTGPAQQPIPTIAFSPSPVTLAAGTLTTINLTASGAGLFAVDLTFSFDPSAFTVSEIRDGGFLSRDGQAVATVQRVDTAGGNIHISLERPAGAPPVSGSGNLVTLVLEPGPKSANSTLRVTEFGLRDAEQNTRHGATTEVQVTSP